MKSHYELLGVAASASADEIKLAFRHEIAKYHPDKVHHLGREFQEIAAVRSAELTQAYKTLMDPAARAEHDAGLASRGGTPFAPPPAGAAEPMTPPSTPAARTPEPEPERAPSPQGGEPFARDRAGVTDLVRKAAVIRFRQAVQAEFGHCDEAPVQGFEFACAPSKGRFFGKIPPRLLARFVENVDAAAVADAAALASRVRRDDRRDICVFVMGPAVASVTELAHAVAEERRRPAPGGMKLVLIPINTRSWLAHIPHDAPPAVKALMTRLKQGS